MKVRNLLSVDNAGVVNACSRGGCVTTYIRNSLWGDMATIASCTAGPVGLASAIGMCESHNHDALRQCLEHVGNQREGIVTDSSIDALVVEGARTALMCSSCDSYIDSRYAPEDPYHLDQAVFPVSVVVSPVGGNDRGNTVHGSASPLRRKVDVFPLKATYVLARPKANALKRRGEPIQWVMILQKGRG